MKKSLRSSFGIARLILIVIFSAMLAAPVFLARPGNPSSDPMEGGLEATAIETFGFYLENATEKTGVQFRHQAPKLHSSINHIMPQIASMGASVSVVDYDRDGWNDFYLTNSEYGTKNALYHNEQDGSFKDMAEELGVADVNQAGTGTSMGAVWGDYDNDGYEDLFLYKWGKPELFRNKSGTGFERVTEGSGLPRWINSNTAVWFDYNNDGLLDLFIGGYYREDLDLWNLSTTVIMPESFEYANNGGRNYLMRNKGDGTFQDVARALGLNSTKWTLAAGAVDINGDSYSDLIIANDYGVDEFYQNDKGKKFVEVGKEVGIGFAPKSGMNVSFGDVQNQSLFGIYVSNITESGVLLQGNNLWLPDKSNRSKYTNLARASGVEMGGWSYGSQFGDLNNDGALDLYVANGFISGVKGNSYWYDYSKITGGNKSIISDAANWPDMNGRSQSGYQQNKIWINNGTGVFADVTAYMPEKTTYDSRSVAMVDLWNRGVLDVIVANQNNEVAIYQNNTRSGRHWIAFDLEGLESNRSAIGAIIEMRWNGQIQSQVVSGGIGFASQNQRRLHFGLGENSTVEQAVVYWPSGATQTLRDLSVDKVHVIKEEI